MSFSKIFMFIVGVLGLGGWVFYMYTLWTDKDKRGKYFAFGHLIMFCVVLAMICKALGI